MALLGPYDRSPFAHKGQFGHALLIGGQFGMAGCMILSVQAALRAGCGLATVAVPRDAVTALQVAVPEAICLPDPNPDRITHLPSPLSKYAAVGLGPGLGTHPDSIAVVEALLKNPPTRLVLDADALNILALKPELIKMLPFGAVLTPHPGELDRLVTHNGTALGRLNAARQLAMAQNVFIILKGGYTALCAPNGDVLFNQNGNPGMATGGTGDVLTGFLTGLLAYFDDVLDALVLGIYLHGLAGDLAAQRLGQQALTASALMRMFGKAWMHIEAMRHMPDLLSTAEEEMPF
jgi:NAD(P)H-hydrate epimerase